jgi:glycosyltransferase involved in cell wall biosynthesis
VATSKTIGRALLVADRVYYLDSSLASLTRAIKSFSPETGLADILENDRFCAFSNGLPGARWPTESVATTVEVFWAASLLKWKGLATLLEALRMTPLDDRPQTQICFIQPKATNLEMGPGPEPIEGVTWHENPACLDRIRSECSIFVSTSHNEPFGLSILESMAAGLAVIIPRDGAYWDLRLNDKSDCLKYMAEDAADLALKIRYLQQNPKQLLDLGRRAKQIALEYRSDRVYAGILQGLTSAGTIASAPCPDGRGEFDNV